MHSFVDQSGRIWEIKISVTAIARVKAIAGVDMLAVAGGQVLEVLRDLIKLGDVTYALCKPTADALGLTSETFGEQMAGEALTGASKAIRDELLDFFPSQDRANVQAMLEKSEELISLGRSLVLSRIQKFEPAKVLAEIERVLFPNLSDETPPGDGSGNLPESSESIPAPSASAN